jgi:hypothetical protein
MVTATPARPVQAERVEQPRPQPQPQPYAGLEGNPVARAYARDRGRTASAEESPIGRALVWLVVIPAIVFLVTNPVGWIVLFLLVLGAAALSGFGGIL